MSKKTDKKADAAMTLIWKEWRAFYLAHFRGPGIALSAADQMAFYEIAQPILRGLTHKTAPPHASPERAP